MNSFFDLKGKTALITGSARGIGKVIAVKLLEAGADLFLVDFNRELLMNAVDDLRNQYDLQIEAACADVTVENEVKRAVESCLDKYLTVDILVNNAGMMKRVEAVNFSKDDWSKIIETNLSGTFLFCREIGPLMIEKKAGKVVNMSSLAGVIASRNNLPYSAAKAGVAALTRSLALEWGEYNINVNCVAPYYIHTKLTEGVLEDSEQLERVLKGIPLKRLGTPEDVANAVLFLSSPGADMITGHTLVIDGGCSVR